MLQTGVPFSFSRLSLHRLLVYDVHHQVTLQGPRSNIFDGQLALKSGIKRRIFGS